MTNNLRRKIRKSLKSQIAETHKFLRRKEEEYSCETFEMIAPASYEKLVSSLNDEEIKEFINSLITPEKQMLFDFLSNSKLQEFLEKNYVKFEEISDERVKELFKSAEDDSFFEVCWEKLSLDDKIRLITIILSSPETRSFCLDTFSWQCNIDNIIKFMKELNEKDSYDGVGNRIYLLMATSLPEDILAEFLENDLDNVITEKLVSKLIGANNFLSVFSLICSVYRIELLSRGDFMILKEFKDNNCIFELLSDEECLNLFVNKVKKANMNCNVLFNEEQIIYIYCLLEDESDKKFVLQEVLKDYNACVYSELYEVLPNAKRLEMLEVLLEIPVDSYVKNIMINILREAEGVLERLVLERLEEK